MFIGWHHLANFACNFARFWEGGVQQFCNAADQERCHSEVWKHLERQQCQDQVLPMLCESRQK